MSASVKVMLSYDYCHFEFSKSTDQPVTDTEIDEMRKDCMRLADKAIAQYKIAKAEACGNLSRQGEYENAQRQARQIEAKAEGDRTVNEIALLKAFHDRNWQARLAERYDYQDDWDDDER